MEKINIIVAVFAVALAMASCSRAAELLVDFDGKTFVTGSLRETIKTSGMLQDSSSENWGLPVPVASVAQRQSGQYSAFYESGDKTVARQLAGYYQPLQQKLREALLSHYAAGADVSRNLCPLVQDERTHILYDGKNIYLIIGETVLTIDDKELLRKLEPATFDQTKFGAADAAAAAVFGCVFSSECREDVVNYITGLHDDEHDTYHPSQDGTNPNYEVYTKKK